MLFDNVFDDSKAEAGTLDFLRATGVGTVKAFEYSLLLIFRNADSRVANDQNGTVTVMADGNVDVTVPGGCTSRHCRGGS